jgi:hypothetical protein
LKPARPDRTSPILGLIALVVLGYTAWLRFGPRPWPEPPAAGSAAPPLVLRMPGEDSPRLLLGLRDQVAWVVFEPSRRGDVSEEPDGIAPLRRFARSHPLFRLIVAAPDGEEAGAPDRDAFYPEATRRAFGAKALPFHVLIGEDGRILGTARGDDREALEGLLAVARERLKRLEPTPPDRFT